MRPRPREKGSSVPRHGKEQLKAVLAFACAFSIDTRAPGSKAPPRRTALRRSRVEGWASGTDKIVRRWAGRDIARSMHSGIVQTEGRHALNVEIEVRVLVPELRHGRVAQTGERLSYKQEAAGSSPASPTRRIAQLVEHLSDTEEAAGSTPAPPISRDRSSAR